MATADVASSLISMSLARTRFSASLAVLEKQFQMEKATIDMLDASDRKAPAAPGTGLIVDKQA